MCDADRSPADSAPSRPLRSRLAEGLRRRLIAVPLFLLGVWFLPYLWCARESDPWFDGDPATQKTLANGVAAWMDRDVSHDSFSTGSDRFDGEWVFGTAIEMFQAIKQSLRGSICHFGMVREYPAGSPGGYGDIDSGPLVLSYSISATGFTLASARVHDDRTFFRQLYATSYLFGAPTDRAGCRNYVAGGPLGDAILFAMLTATRLPDQSEEEMR